MKRIIDYYLKQWKTEPDRKPLLVRGARQVGKTYSIRSFGKTFSSFVEINFDLDSRFATIFNIDLKPERIIREISILTGKEIVPGKTLLFFDEIQKAPNAVASLRYFYELRPDLHVIAAGSLLDFALDTVGLPVGRVSSIRMYPLSFFEFITACGHESLTELLIDVNSTITTPIHEMSIRLLSEYLFLGGMPSIVNCWSTSHDHKRCVRLQDDILDTYRQDFQFYSRKHQQKYVDLLFQKVPESIGRKFVYTSISSDFRKRGLQPALELLIKAGIVNTVTHTSGQGIPLGSDINVERFKCLFLDCGLTLRSLGTSAEALLSAPQYSLINKGEICEALIGQEILSASSPYTKKQLYYWHREARSSNAEIDYLLQINTEIIPIEVKSGDCGSLKSLHLFLDDHKKSPFGICFSSGIHTHTDRIKNYPLYKAASVANNDPDALRSLL